MKNAIQEILFLLVALSGAMGATSYESATENVVKSFSASSGGTLTIESDRGSIKVEPWDQQVVEVSVEKKAKNQKQLDGFKVGISQKDNGVFVEGGGGIRVGVADGNVAAKTSGGAIKINVGRIILFANPFPEGYVKI